MPIGIIPWENRLGIANVRVSEAAGFAQTVLSLPVNSPIFQQHIAHSTPGGYNGPGRASADWYCPADYQTGNSATIREISPADTFFSRRNLASDQTDPWTGTIQHSLVSHRAAYNNQIYYVLNEPERGTS